MDDTLDTALELSAKTIFKKMGELTGVTETWDESPEEAKSFCRAAAFAVLDAITPKLMEMHAKNIEASFKSANEKLAKGTLHIGYCNADSTSLVGSDMCICVPGLEIKKLRTQIKNTREHTIDKCVEVLEARHWLDHDRTVIDIDIETLRRFKASE